MKVVIIDEKGQITGKKEEAVVHREGILHLAYVIYVFNKKGEVFLPEGRPIHKHVVEDLITEVEEEIKKVGGNEGEEEFSFTYWAEEEGKIEFEKVFVFSTIVDRTGKGFVKIEEVVEKIREGGIKKPAYFLLSFERVLSNYGWL